LTKRLCWKRDRVGDSKLQKLLQGWKMLPMEEELRIELGQSTNLKRCPSAEGVPQASGLHAAPQNSLRLDFTFEFWDLESGDTQFTKQVTRSSEDTVLRLLPLSPPGFLPWLGHQLAV
jgi:hypothetical protein